ncbi:MAG: DUF2254 domain-containing protein [Candidatus Dormiibacterota bacterium]
MSWGRRSRIRTSLRGQLWVVPALCIVGALVLAEITPILDRATARFFDGRVDVDSVRSGLSATASGMLAFTGFVFAITLLQVQFGSSALSPRIPRLLRRDGLTKAALGTFTATFVYSLETLVEVGADQSNFVPGVSWCCSIVLLLGSLVAFLLLLQRSADRYRVGGVLQAVSVAGQVAIDEVHPCAADPDRDERAGPRGPVSKGNPTRVLRHLGRPATLAAFDFDGAVKLAEQQDATLWLVPNLGDFLVEGSPFLLVQGGTAQLDRRMRRAATFGDEPMIDQDPSFALRLLVDIAVKSISSAHDPTSATQVLDRLEDLLGRLGARSLGSGQVADSSGVIRLYYSMPTWTDYLELALEEIRLYGSGAPQVLRRMRALLDDLHRRVLPFRRPAVEGQLARLDQTVEQSFPSAAERMVASVPDRQGLGSGTRAPAVASVIGERPVRDHRRTRE